VQGGGKGGVTVRTGPLIALSAVKGQDEVLSDGL
jgi:hypothetical protein